MDQSRQVANSQATLIDLTDDGDQGGRADSPLFVDSDDVWFLGERERLQQAGGAGGTPPVTNLQRSQQNFEGTSIQHIQIDDDESSASPEIEFVSSRRVPPVTTFQLPRSPSPAVSRVEPPTTVSSTTGPFRLPFSMPLGLSYSPPNMGMLQRFHAFANTRLRAAPEPLRVHMDFNRTADGFDYGRVQPDTSRERAGTTYVAPAAASDGFTRSPGEDDIVVCVCCGDELCVGPTEQKQQAWVIKKCGHVYCGDCYHGKGAAFEKRKRGRGRGGATCTVEGCEGKFNKRTMIQLYL